MGVDQVTAGRHLAELLRDELTEGDDNHETIEYWNGRLGRDGVEPRA